MFSYHPRRIADPNAISMNAFAWGFKCENSNDPQVVADRALAHVTSMSVFKNGHRAEPNFITANWIGLDFDDQEVTLAEASRLFCDSIHVIGTTKSHQREKSGRPPCDRFRVFLRFAAPLNSVREYRYNVQKILARHPAADTSCQDAARFFAPITQIISVQNDGYEQDVDLDVPEEFERRYNRSLITHSRTKTIPWWLKEKLNKPAVIHTRNKTVFGLAKDLLRLDIDFDTVVKIIAKSQCWDGLRWDKDVMPSLNSAYKNLLKERGVADDGRRCDQPGEEAGE